MSIQQFKSSFRKQLKEKNLSIRIFSKEHRTIVSNSWKQYFDSEYRCKTFAYMCIHWKWDGRSESLINENLDYWETISKIEKKAFITFYHANVDSILPLLEKKGYKKINEYLTEAELNELTITDIVRYEHTKDYVKEIFPGFFKKLASVDKKLNEALERMKEEDPTFVFEQDYSKKELKTLSYYFKGHNDTFTLSFSDGTFTLKNSSHTLSFNETDNLTEILLSYFNDMEKKLRLKNIYSPPKKHFYNALKIVGLGEANTASEQVYQGLINDYKPEEIEQYASTINHVSYELLYCAMVFKFLDVYFVYNHKELAAFEPVYCSKDKNEIVRISEKMELYYIEELLEKRKKDINDFKENLKKL